MAMQSALVFLHPSALESSIFYSLLSSSYLSSTAFHSLIALIPNTQNATAASGPQL